MAPKKIDIGLKNDQIMQRYLVRRIHREIEFSIKEQDGTENIGFITGFDEICIQMSLTPKNAIDEPRAKLIFWPISSIEETGRRVVDLPVEHTMKIRSYTHALRKQCEATLSGDNDKAAQRTPPPVEVPFSAAQ